MKLCAPKVTGVAFVGISRLPFGSPRTKNHLDVAPMERHIVYYKGESDGFPQVWAVVSLVSPSCSWFILAPKVLQLCTKHFVLLFCRFVLVLKACQFFLVPSQSSACKVMGPQSHGSPSCVNFETPIWEFWDKMPFGC